MDEAIHIQGKKAYDKAMEEFDRFFTKNPEIFEECSAQYKTTFSLAFCEGWMTAQGWRWDDGEWVQEN